jgi:hypothetical protein
VKRLLWFTILVGLSCKCLYARYHNSAADLKWVEADALAHSNAFTGTEIQWTVIYTCSDHNAAQCSHPDEASVCADAAFVLTNNFTHSDVGYVCERDPLEDNPPW